MRTIKGAGRWRSAGMGLISLLLSVGLVACGSGEQSAASGDTALAADSGTVQAGEASLFYRTLGEGRPLVVLHGGPGLEHSYFLPALEPLARNYRLIFYDQRASGRSEAPVDSASISLDQFLSDLDRIRQELAGEQMVVLGHSWGGLVGILYASRHPEHVAALVLVGTIEPGQRYREETSRRQRARQTAADSAAIARLVRSDAFGRRQREAVNELYRLSFRSSFADTALADRLPVDFTARTARAAGRVPALLLGPLDPFDFWDRLAEIEAPTLVTHGAEDPIPPAMARELAERVPDARYVEIPDAGHFPFVEAPDTLFSAVRRFLEEQGGR